MSSAAEIFELIKVTYLNTAADLAVLSKELDNEIRKNGHPTGINSGDLKNFCSKLTMYIQSGNGGCIQAAKFQNSVSPPSYKKPKPVLSLVSHNYDSPKDMRAAVTRRSRPFLSRVK